LLAASDQAFIVSPSSDSFDKKLLSRLPNAARINLPGAVGWNQALLKVLGRV